MQIFLARNNKQAGPYTLEELNTMLSNQQVELTDLAWHEGLDKWQPLSELTGGERYYTGMPSASPSMPPVPQRVQPIDQSVIQKRGEPKAEKKASIGARIGAVIMDQILYALCFLPVLSHVNVPLKELQDVKTPEQFNALYQQIWSGIPTSIQGFFVISLVSLIILQVFILSTRGQSLGKLFLGIRVVDRTTRHVPTVTNILLLRTFAFSLAYNLPIVGVFIFLTDIVMFLFGKDNLALHDHVAKTEVVVAQDSQLKK